MVQFVNLLAIAVLLSFVRDYASAADTISLSDSLSDDSGGTLNSSDGSFELGFFSPGSSTNRYVGIWYKNIGVPRVVWVANRCNPINGTSGKLAFNRRGNLVLLGGNRSVVWSTNATRVAQNPIAQLLDSGNLVIRNPQDTDSSKYFWQSFDYPTDTVVSGMKIGWNLKTGFNRYLSAWRSPDDPCPGDITWGIELNNHPQPALWKGSQKLFRGSPYTSLVITEATSPNRSQLYNSSFVVTKDEAYLIFYMKSKSFLAIAVVNQTAESYQCYSWSEATESWRMSLYLPKDYCDKFGLCGPFGSCMGGSAPCQCLRGFTPKSQENWDSAYWSEGCMRKNPLNCQNGDGFAKVLGLELPDTTHTWVNESMSLDECRAKCLENCSCTAYSNFDMSGAGSGCALWFHDLIDLRRTIDDKKPLFVRMSAADLSEERKHKATMKITVIIVTVIAVLFVMLAAAGYSLFKRRKISRDKKVDLNSEKDIDPETQDLELPLFGIAEIVDATNNFSEENKLGKGGFGTVYKGTLVDGQDIAVKRLSKSSGQGLNEFKNEVILIAKLQHRNLVKLLGCCIQEDEKMLIYEYMPNKSLDFFIFDEKRSKLLDWSRRYHIICGIARGLIYLHQDSRLRIIHRDLKASNVLLDSDMNPKISDFGMARTFGGDQTEGNTNRVVGTYGYMAPEYATDGLFSVKSDVFSFGILLLEIISGKRSRGFYHLSDNNLIGYAWRLWKEGKQTELVDEAIAESCDLTEVNRCIHIGLLCVQQHPENRPDMASVVLMLSRESLLPQPNEPGFFKERGSLEETSSTSKQGYFSTNEVTISLLQPR